MSKRSNSLPELTKAKHQTIFIHKLYDMLQDTKINNLIWWSDSSDSFFIVPNESFSKVLSSYFKHTNIASFIRQLNMYGFHKMNGNTATSTGANTGTNTGTNPTANGGNGSGATASEQSTSEDGAKDVPTGPVWEFKHSHNQFRKGDVQSLRLIKRRSSKNINKETFFINTKLHH